MVVLVCTQARYSFRARTTALTYLRISQNVFLRFVANETGKWMFLSYRELETRQKIHASGNSKVHASSAFQQKIHECDKIYFYDRKKYKIKLIKNSRSGFNYNNFSFKIPNYLKTAER